MFAYSVFRFARRWIVRWLVRHSFSRPFHEYFLKSLTEGDQLWRRRHQSRVPSNTKITLQNLSTQFILTGMLLTQVLSCRTNHLAQTASTLSFHVQWFALGSSLIVLPVFLSFLAYCYSCSSCKKHFLIIILFIKCGSWNPTKDE